jgi:hypothetical protein
MPRVLVVGPVGTYSALGFQDITHGSHVRALSIARALAATGLQTDLLDQTGNADVSGVREPSLGSLAQYDAVVVAGIAGLWRLRASGHYAALVAHPAVSLVVDSVYGGDDAPECLGFVRVLLATSPAVADAYGVFRAPGRTCYAPWGCSETDAGANPWPDERQRVLFAGIVHERFADVLNMLAERLAAEVWVAGVFHRDGGLGGLTADYRRALLSPRVHLATDTLPRTSHGEGPVVYESVCRLAAHATVGLNLVITDRHALMGTSCKVYDYFGMGLPVVSEPSPASGPDIEALGGVVVPWGDVGAIEAAVVRALDTPFDRAGLATRARARCSWAGMVQVILAGLGTLQQG